MSQHDSAWWAAYRAKNREHLRVYKKEWHHKTKDKRAAYLKEYYLKNRGRICKKNSENSKKRRLEILSMLGNSCVKCGYSDDYRALQIDHVYGNGYIERREMTHSWSYKFWKKALTERRSEYQLLCANCNWIKKVENKEGWWNKKCLIS